MNPIQTLRRFFGNVERSTQLLAEIREGIANLPQENRHAQMRADIRETITNLADRTIDKAADRDEGDGAGNGDGFRGKDDRMRSPLSLDPDAGSLSQRSGTAKQPPPSLSLRRVDV